MNVTGYQPIDELPPSEKPWRIHAFERSVVLLNPDHPPRIIREGRIEVMEPAPIPGEIPQACVRINSMSRFNPKLFTHFGGKS